MRSRSPESFSYVFNGFSVCQHEQLNLSLRLGVLQCCRVWRVVQDASPPHRHCAFRALTSSSACHATKKKERDRERGARERKRERDKQETDREGKERRDEIEREEGRRGRREKKRDRREREKSDERERHGVE